LDWDNETVEKNLNVLHAYALDFVYSAIDWYINRSRWSKLWSWVFRLGSYLCALAGAVLPLIMIFGPRLITDVAQRIGPTRDEGGIAAEAALALIAVAAVLNVIDRLAGFSRDWIRYRAVIDKLDNERIKLEFEWNDVAMQKAKLRDGRSPVLSKTNNAPAPGGGQAMSPPTETPPAPGPAGQPSAGCATEQVTEQPCPPAPAQPEVTKRVGEQVDLVYAFCLTVLKIQGEETNSWEQEFSRSIEKFSDHIQAGTFIHRPGK
jgi:hypothetical protein